VFPSHIGSRSTCKHFSRRQNNFTVSIPHWFSLNTLKKCQCLPKPSVSIPHWFSLNLILSHCQSSRLAVVSIPHWFSLNVRNTKIIASTHYVSIPHWFSLNMPSSPLRYLAVSCFHPTLVLAQPAPENCKNDGIGRFHPTLVLAQPSYVYLFRLSGKFPSHIGSRSTVNSTCWHMAGNVSFHPTLVLAQPTFSTAFRLLRLRFHPTLVLAQPRSSSVISCHSLPFPSHIGSRSTWRSASLRQVMFKVSIPHWFSLNHIILHGN